MLVSSMDKVLDSMRPDEGQSARSFVFSVLAAMEPQDDVEFIGAPDFAIVRNYVSTFGTNKGRKYRCISRPGSLFVRRDK